MLKRWQISNFKSIPPGAPALDLAPLTLVCGANSSGKSTLIQSILLVAQTLGSQAQDRTIILNGELVKLGFVPDVLHRGPRPVGSPVPNLELGLDLQVDPPLPGSGHTLNMNGVDGRIVLRSSFRPSTEKLSDATSSRFSVVDTVLDGGTYKVKCSALQQGESLPSVDPKSRLPGALVRRIRRGDFEYRLEETTDSSSSEVRKGKQMTFCSLMHFLPETKLVWGIALRDALQAVARLLAEQDQEFPAGLEFKTRAGSQLREELAQTLGAARNRRDVRAELGIQELSRAQKLLDVAEDVPHWAQLLSRQEDFRQLAFKVSQTIAARSPLMSTSVWLELREPRTVEFDGQVKQACGLLREFFVDRVKYLGPLRDDPRLIYEIPSDPDSRDVGLVGEYTAFVLERFGADEVKCPLPARGGSSRQEFESMSLGESVLLWLKHMDLARDIKMRDRGKIGIEFKLQVPGLEEELGLTDVGVGVSQVLPMLTMSLLAPPGALVLMEQPELHLHPRLQAQLGDFLLGIGLRGTQCIVETHSEWLVNRVRRRIAESPGDTIMRQVRIYFAEKKGAATKFRPVEPNRFGAISEWPEGFFDEGSDEAEAIIEAASRKMEAERQEKAEAMRKKQEGRE